MQTRAHSSLLFFLTIPLALGALPAFASRPVRVYEVEVRAIGAATAVQDAMRAALVRATGSREAAADAALAAIIANAARYVQATRPATQGTSTIVFDGAAVEKDIAAAGRTVWRRDRPFVLVTLEPQPAGQLADTARRTLEQVAEARGLPISVIPTTALDSTGAEVATPGVLRAAQRLGADAVLVGQGDNAALNGQWRWSLYSAGITQDFSGSLESGVNGAADQLARAESQQASAGDAGLTIIQIDGVATLADYAGVARALEALPGVQRVQIREVSGDSATWQVLVRGGSQSLSRALATSSTLQESGSDPARLVYHYRR
jgi:hypothetical protein